MPREWARRVACVDRTIDQRARSGALPFLSGFDLNKTRPRSRRRHFAGLNRNQPVLHFVRIFEQTALRRTRRARAVAVICTTMARAHEEAGLRKPAKWTA